MSKAELIDQSQAIVVATIEKVKPASLKGMQWTYHEGASIHIEQILKGPLIFRCHFRCLPVPGLTLEFLSPTISGARLDIGVLIPNLWTKSQMSSQAPERHLWTKSQMSSQAPERHRRVSYFLSS